MVFGVGVWSGTLGTKEDAQNASLKELSLGTEVEAEFQIL